MMYYFTINKVAYGGNSEIYERLEKEVTKADDQEFKRLVECSI